MPERLLNREQAARRLAMSPRTFSRYKAKLIAMGLQTVNGLGRNQKFRESSLDQIIQLLAEEKTDEYVNPKTLRE